MKKFNSHHFLIVGLGPAGVAAAMELKRQGHQVTIWERQNEVGRQVCGEYLTPEGRELAEKLGWHDYLKDSLPVEGMQLFAPNGAAIKTKFPFAAFGLSLNRQKLLQQLADAAKEMGIEIEYGRQLTALLATHGGVKVTAGDYQLSVDYVIGADGRQSKVARFLGLESTTVMDQKRVAIHAYLKPHKALKRYGEMHIFGDGSYIGVNPITAEEVNISIVLSVEAMKRHKDARAALNSYLSISPSLQSRFPLVTTEEVRVAFPLGRKTQQIHHPRGCLIGDAAGFIDPLTGEGITSALKTALMLSECVHATGNISEAFATYAQLRRKKFAEKENINYGFQHLIRHPELVNLVGFLLTRSQLIRDLFIGIVGNVITPKEAIKCWLRDYQEVRHGQSHRSY